MKKSTMTEMASAPPPPPLSKGSRKTLIAVIVIAIIAIAAVAAGVYLATQSGGGGGPSASVTPTPTPSAAVTPTPTGANVAGASSLQFTVDVTGGSSQGTYKYMAKNIGTSNMMIRIEVTSTSGNLVYIVNGAQQKAWAYESGAWTDLSAAFSDQWSAWNSTWTGYESNLAGWTGTGDWAYTAPDGSTIRIHEISVNPSLADSLFAP
jgi:hypothetical protein